MPTLDWLHRDAAFRIADAVPYRTLDPVSAHGDGSAHNLLVHGDNLQALKALLPLYRAQVKCIFIDPPYNTKSAFEHYDDNLEHSQWLSMMLPQLQLRREFLREDGSIWVTIDDNEGHYLKVLMDEVFGRSRFIANCVWQKRYARDNTAAIGSSNDHLLVYAVNGDRFRATRNRIEPDAKTKGAYSNPNGDPNGPWQSISFSGAGVRPNQGYVIEGPDGTPHRPPEGRHWATLEPEYKRLRSAGRFWFGKDGTGVPRVIRYLSEVNGLVPWSWWPHDDVGHNDEAKKESNALFGANASFGTPKPERLIQRILHIATNPNDLVLDSFLGSGTTAAVAHKMGRRWIGVERGEHAVTHCLPRLQKVVEGEQGGISAAVGWQGGGGFRFARLGEPVFDAEGRIDPRVRFAALAAFVWQQATRTAFAPAELGGLAGARPGTPQLGVHEGTAVLLLYNGILGDRRPEGGNVLNLAVLQALKRACPHDGPRIVFGEACTLGPARLTAERIEFRQIPYELAAR
jgi:adenine-specific DNA-methyltransferase